MTFASQSNYSYYKANEFERDQYPARLSTLSNTGLSKAQWTVRLFMNG